MYKFSNRSMNNLLTCDIRLQKLFLEVIKHIDCAVICGHRGEYEQMEAYHAGRSKLAWPHSKHNYTPSKAVDCVPYPINWSDLNRFYHFGGLVRGIASQMQIDIVWGGDWNMDNDLKNQTFFDFPHWELK